MALRRTDRILVLAKIDPKTKADMMDPEVFEGKNNLHAVMDNSTCLWSFKYERGLPPEPLRQRFTNFNTLKAAAENYFSKKNVRIVEVID